MMRDRRPEAMDDPGLDSEDHAAALRSLHRMDRLLRTDRRLVRRLRNSNARDGSVLDLACGGGGFLGRLARDGAPSLLIGVDRSARALGWACSWQPTTIHWIAADAGRLPFADKSIDRVTCSLFVHHLEEAQAVHALRESARVARAAVHVVDLRRSWVAWALTWLATRVVSRSWVFRTDGPRSVRAAFSAEEMAQLARRAGLDGASVRRSFPFRLVLTWKAPSVHGSN